MTVLFRMGEKGLRSGYGGTLTHLTLEYETVFCFGTDKPPLKKSIETSNIHLKRGAMIDVHPWDVEFHTTVSGVESSFHLSFDDIREIQIWKPNPQYQFGKTHQLYKTIHQVGHRRKHKFDGKERIIFFDSEWK